MYAAVNNLTKHIYYSKMIDCKLFYFLGGYINPPSADPQSTLVNNTSSERPATPPSYDENVPRRKRIQFVNQVNDISALNTIC